MQFHREKECSQLFNIKLLGDISEALREKLLLGVQVYLQQLIDETTEGLSSTLSLSVSSSVRHPIRRMKENVGKLSDILLAKVCIIYTHFHRLKCLVRLSVWQIMVIIDNYTMHRL